MIRRAGGGRLSWEKEEDEKAMGKGRAAAAESLLSMHHSMEQTGSLGSLQRGEIILRWPS